MVVDIDNLKSVIKNFLNTHKYRLEMVCQKTIEIAETAKREFIADSHNPLFLDSYIRQWAINSIHIIQRPGTIKSYESLKRKLTKIYDRGNDRFWSILNSNRSLEGKQVEELYKLIKENIDDLTGIEVRFPNTTMIMDYKVFLKQEVEKETGHKHIKTFDYILNPQPDGYRAIHFIFKVDSFWSEVQLKTHLAKSWEYFTHDLFYTSSHIFEKFESLQNRLITLSNLYQSCDEVGNQIIKDLGKFSQDIRKPILKRR